MIDDSTLILFDNGNTRRASDATADSRGQVWKLDEQTMTATLEFNFDLGNYSMALGSAQRLSNGDYVFTSGFQGTAPHLFGQAIEVRPDGSKAYVLQVNRMEYRSFRVQTLYAGVSDQLAGSDGGETSRHGDDSDQQEGNGPARVARTDFPDDFVREIIAALTVSAGQPTPPTTLGVARSIWATAAPLVLVGEPDDDPAFLDLPAGSASAARDALFADAANDLWHEGLGDDLARALSS